MKEYQKCSMELLEFIRKSPTCFHAVENVGRMLSEAGFVQLQESEDWNLQPGGKYYAVRNDSSVIAFVIPGEAERVKGFHIVASHSDSPCFKVKEAPECVTEQTYVKLNTEKYGGMILSTWLDRALSVAGRIAVRGENGIRTGLVNIDRDLCVIPNVAIHMNRDMNSGVAYNAQTDMLPLYGTCREGKKASLLQQIAEEAGVKTEDILGHDLFLYAREKGGLIGAEGEFVLSPRLDDLQCAFASVKAFLQAEPADYINVCAVFDNEEVGSCTRQGADSTFLEDTLRRTAACVTTGDTGYLKLVAGSFLISADNAHAVHPNHPEKADPTNRPVLNGGIVIKFHGSQRYATDGVSAAMLKNWCMDARVPFQTYANRSDIPGGSTLGNLSMRHVSLAGADIGLPQLAMHSAVETAGVKDTAYAIAMLEKFYGE